MDSNTVFYNKMKITNSGVSCMWLFVRHTIGELVNIRTPAATKPGSPEDYFFSLGLELLFMKVHYLKLAELRATLKVNKRNIPL